MIEPVTSASQEATSRCWVFPILAALVAVLATLLSSASASAATQGVAETRVRASNPVVDVLVEPPQREPAGQRLGNDGRQVVTVVATGVAANAADDVASASNKIYSNRALQRMADEPGPFHNFPGSFDDTVFSQGNRTVVPNYFNKAKPNLGNDSIQYRLPGYLNGRAGTYEIFTRPSLSGRTEMIMHRFFRPDY